MMKPHSSLILFLTLFSAGLFGQTVPDITLREKAKEAGFGQAVHQVLVKGGTDAITGWIERNDGKVKYRTGDWVAAGLRGDKLKQLAVLEFVESFYFRNYPGTLLNDRMIVNANVAGLQNSWQFDSSLTGKGVIIGFVDAGIDYTHEDFIDENGNSRILYVWDQKPPADSSLIYAPYGYGRLYTQDSLSYWLANGIVFPLDPDNLYGHGSHVTGIAAGNGRALAEQVEQGLLPADFHGVAVDSKIIMVATDLNAENWLATVADGVDFILKKADSLGLPVVVNLSVGTYLGSHDALDAVGSEINDWFDDSHPGRMLVCAAGNSGNARYHLGYHSDNDTSFSAFRLDDALSGPGNGAFFEAWIDSAEAALFDISAGLINLNAAAATVSTGFYKIKDNIDTVLTDTLFSDTVPVGIVSRFAEYRGEQIRLQVKADSVFENNAALAFYTRGSGRVDIWSAGWLGTSDILGPEELAGIPDNLLQKYRAPDSLMQVVSSFSCAPNVLTIGSYRNRVSYLDVNGNSVNFEGQTGEKAPSSSRGPTRDGRYKPDLTAGGEVVLSTGSYNEVAAALNINPAKVAQGGRHLRNRGTSMASPVVAGVAALYLQHCPDELPSFVRQKITGTAVQDIFTGPLPNFGWGHGKIDALAAVNSTLFEVTVIQSESDMCAEGEIQLQTAGIYDAYRWSTGDTTERICVPPGTYSVTVTGPDGCWSISDPVEVTVDGISEAGNKVRMIYPNPNRGAFVLQDARSAAKVQITDLSGREINFGSYITGEGMHIELTNPAPGIYFVRVQGWEQTFKILVR